MPREISESRKVIDYFGMMLVATGLIVLQRVFRYGDTGVIANAWLDRYARWSPFAHGVVSTLS